MLRRSAPDVLAAGVLMLVALLMLGACAAPYVRPPGSAHVTPRLLDDAAIMDDGFRLPLSRWESGSDCAATILALHGLNDYRNAFRSTGEFLASRGIRVIAYDQRGFGETGGFGEWHGSDRLISDLHTMAGLVASRYPDCPLYLLGESMGGAVLLAGVSDLATPFRGMILVAPAVWSRDSMPLYQRALLWLAAHSFPAKQLTGKGLDLQPSDNIEMLRALGRDPLVIKATRVDVLYGVTNLMDAAARDMGRQAVASTLFLYGERDDIIPRQPVCRVLQNMAPEAQLHTQVALYEQGYHMLTRDLQAEKVLEDIAEWVLAPSAQQWQTTGNVERLCAASS